MKANTSESSQVTDGPHNPWSRASAIVLALAVGSFGLYAIVSAPSALQTAERVKAEQIRMEDREYCEKFRMPPGSEAFATCAADLAELRRRHRDRVVAEAAGML